MQVPGGLLEIGWEALDQAVSRQARLKKSQRELTQKLDGHEQETDALQETFVSTAQDLYEKMSAGDISGDKAEKKVSAEADALKERLLELQAERADVERRLEALRRSLEASEGEIEAVLKAGAPEQSSRLAETILGAVAELESKVFSALAEGRKVRDSYFALQTSNAFRGATSPGTCGGSGRVVAALDPCPRLASTRRCRRRTRSGRWSSRIGQRLKQGRMYQYTPWVRASRSPAPVPSAVSRTIDRRFL